MNEKMFNDFLNGKWKGVIYIKDYLIKVINI